MHASTTFATDPAARNGETITPTPGAVPGNGAPIASAAETPPAVSGLTFDLDGPLNAAHAATRALQDLVDKPIGAREQDAVAELAASIMGEINTLRAQFKAISEAVHAPVAAALASAMPLAISDMVFDMESPISTAEEAVDAMQLLIEDGIPEGSEKAVICLAGDIRLALYQLLTKYEALFKATRTPQQRAVQAAFAARGADGKDAPKPAEDRSQATTDPAPAVDARKWKLSEAQEREYRDLLELPFVHREANGDLVSWRPAEISLEDDKPHAAYAVGTHYALLAIDHLRRHGGKVEVASLLNGVASEIAERGAEKWGSIETSFFYALGEYISCREVTVGDSFDATYIGDGDDPCSEIDPSQWVDQAVRAGMNPVALVDPAGNRWLCTAEINDFAMQPRRDLDQSARKAIIERLRAIGRVEFWDRPPGTKAQRPAPAAQ